MLRRVIVGGTRNVLEAAGELGDHRVVVVSSTAAINGSEQPRIFDERSPFTVRDPVLTYAHAKHHAELLIDKATKKATVYLLDSKVKNAVPISASTLWEPKAMCHGNP